MTLNLLYELIYLPAGKTGIEQTKSYCKKVMHYKKQAMLVLNASMLKLYLLKEWRLCEDGILLLYNYFRF